ncbi:MAG: A/G-specific adenine glycosylase [Bacteroidetes bacterium]|nr:A/G-specific adenine glycosylase [Bacteroidota bacterium]MDA0972563.1 A/G-specific adenine glycosylase [Bacteroidota bacterium]
MKSSNFPPSKIAADLLSSWFLEHQRELPWRTDKEPYRIWLSEVILQQTQVSQGLPYFQAFVAAFPDVHALAMASEDAVLNQWQGLGYYSRARNLHKTAKFVSMQLNGVFPKSYSGLLELPGIGPYTAAAIASICYEEAVPVVDGNVQRVIARHFLVEEAVNSSVGAKMVHALSKEWIKGQTPSVFNQAMMELGALVCRPKAPLCSACPIADTCMALRIGVVSELPVKRPKKPPVDRYLHFSIPIQEGKTQLIKRGDGSIWAGLYEFPNEELDEKSFRSLKGRLSKSGKMPPPTLTHLLSHQRIHALFSLSHQPFKSPENSVRVALDELQDYPMSRLMSRFLDGFTLLDLPAA